MKISWITFGAPVQDGAGALTSNLASLRYRVLSPIATMPKGHMHQIVPIGPEADNARREAALNADLLIFSKSFLPANEELARRAQARGVPVIFDVCDNHYDHPQHGAHYRAMTALADQVVCATDEMKQVAGAYAKAPPVVIDDPYEGARGEPRFAPGERLKLLWYGHPSNIDSLRSSIDDLAGYAKTRPLSLVILTTPSAGLSAWMEALSAHLDPDFEVSVEPWSLAAQAAALQACDAVVIPTLPTENKAVKSGNRLVSALWAGRPAVAQPMPAYRAYKVWTPIHDALSEGLAALEQDPSAWVAKVRAAQNHIAVVNAPSAIGQRWDNVIRAVGPKTPVAPPPPAPTPAHSPRAILPATGPVRLNLGCGDKILPGFVNVDVVESRAGKKPDVICDLHKLTPFDDDSADEIMAIHVVEHFWRWEVVDILKEWIRVLKPGGKMILECPNLISACEAVLADPENATLPGPEGQRSMWVLYGDPRWHDPLMVHRWAYTPKSLAQIMHAAGLHELRQEPAQFKLREPRDMRITGVKPAAR